MTGYFHPPSSLSYTAKHYVQIISLFTDLIRSYSHKSLSPVFQAGKGGGRGES